MPNHSASNRTGRFSASMLSLAGAIALCAGTTTSLAQDGGSPLSLLDALNAQEGAQTEPMQTEDDLSRLDGAVTIDEYDLVDLHVNNEDLGNVLQLLSLQSQRNIITSNAVSASVTADLYGVTFYEALDAILHVNGFGYIEQGNFIYVYTREELLQLEAASRARVAKVIRLNHLNAVDAAEFVRGLLSDNGEIKTNARTPDFTIGDTGLTGADDYANEATMVVFDFEENIEEIEALVAQIDTKPVQVLVEATILQTSLNEANAFGVDFSILNNMDFTDFITNGPLGVVDDLISGTGTTLTGGSETPITVPARGNGSALNSNVGNVGGEATFKAGIVNEDVAVFLRLLDQVSDITVVSNPKLLTLNRQPARVLVGTKVGFLNTTSTETATTQTVEFLDTGTQLSLRPFVSNDSTIRMELKPQVSSFTLRNTTDSNGATVTIPDEDTSELVTNVMVQDGQTIVLGGLFTETTTANRRQVPLLGDIPLIGSAFRGHDDSTRRSEIIFLVTPSIVEHGDLTLAGELATNYVDNARSGAREGLLPWSRERRVGQMLVEARALAEEGKRDEALFKIQRALALHPQAADAIKLREAIMTGDPTDWPTRSMLNDLLEDELRTADGFPPQVSAEPSNSAPQANATPSGATNSFAQNTTGSDSVESDWLLGEADFAGETPTNVDADAYFEAQVMAEADAFQPAAKTAPATASTTPSQPIEWSVGGDDFGTASNEPIEWSVGGEDFGTIAGDTGDAAAIEDTFGGDSDSAFESADANDLLDIDEWGLPLGIDAEFEFRPEDFSAGFVPHTDGTFTLLVPTLGGIIEIPLPGHLAGPMDFSDTQTDVFTNVPVDAADWSE